MKEWNININGMDHTVVFEGCKLSGKAKLIIDNEPGLYSPFLVKKVGMFYPFEIDGSEIILKLDLTNNPVGLIQDGKYVDTGFPMEEEAVTALKNFSQSNNPIVKKEQAGMGSFLTFVVLTFINLVLILINATISFPFSAFIPQILVAAAVYGYNENLLTIPEIVIYIIISIFIAAVFLILYLLAKKRTWPVIVSLVLVSIDTLLLVLLSLEDITSSLIDILFHFWVLISFIGIIKNRKAMQRVPSDILDTSA